MSTSLSDVDKSKFSKLASCTFSGAYCTVLIHT